MQLKKDGIYYMYLRKSRRDAEAETYGEGETLVRHEKALKDLAQRLGIEISRYYKEIVSGDTIAGRPQMQKLLHDIEDKHCDGVLVMEVERLGRGDQEDQGAILKAFKYSNTLVITPLKIYDMTDETDEEYCEFNLFMSRKEYKTIKRRLESGRFISASEGKFIGNHAPYGYERIKLKNEKGFTLTPIPERAAIVKLIFELIAHGNSETNNIPIGTSAISHYLYNHNIPSEISDTWEPCVIREIITNPVYIGKIRYRSRPSQKAIRNGELITQRPRNTEPLVFDGRHPAIINDELYEKANKTLTEASYGRGMQKRELKNPFAGLLYCGKCKKSMFRKPSTKTIPIAYIECRNIACDNISSTLQSLEEGLLDSLENWLKQYELEYTSTAQNNYAKEITEKKELIAYHTAALSTLQSQFTVACDMLEQGIYTIEIYKMRTSTLTAKIAAEEKTIHDLEETINQLQHTVPDYSTIATRFRHILDVYNDLTVPEKNLLLREVLERIEYTKEQKGTKYQKSGFTLKLFPKLPK